jgi:hypothetical protein
MSFTKHPILLNRFELPMPNSTPGVPDAMEKHAHRIAMEADSEAVAAAKAIPASIRMDNEWSMPPGGPFGQGGLIPLSEDRNVEDTSSSQSAPSGPTREVNVILIDAYGDGYNGVTIKQKGGQGLVLGSNFTSGRKSNEVVQIECGKDLEFECSQDGDWHSEVSFQILDREYTDCVKHQEEPWVVHVECEPQKEEPPKDCSQPGNTGNLTATNECETCDEKPDNSTFGNLCEWECDEDYFPRGENTCEPLKTKEDCSQPGRSGLVTEDNQCETCDDKPDNSTFRNFCEWECDEDYFPRGENTCEPLKTKEDCSQPGNTGDVTEDNQCKQCPGAPPNSTFTEFCDWECDDNYYRRGDTCEVLTKPEFCDPGMTVEDNKCVNTCEKPDGASYTRNGTCDFKCNEDLPDGASYEDGTCNIVCNDGRFLRKGVMQCEDIVLECPVGEELDSENNMCTACPESPENSEYFDGCQWQCKDGFEIDTDGEGNAFCKKLEVAPEPPSHEGRDHREMQAGAGPCTKDPESPECQKFMESMQRFGGDPNAPEGTQTFGSEEDAMAAADAANFDPGMLSDEERNQGLADVARQREREGKNMPEAEEGQPSSECVSKCKDDQACMASCMGGMNMGYEPGQTRDDLEKPDMSGVSDEDKKRMKMKGMSDDEKRMFNQSGGDPSKVDDATRERMTRGMDESMYNPDSQENRGNKDMFEKMQAAGRMGGPPETDIMGDFIDQVLDVKCNVMSCEDQGLSSLECLTEVCEVSVNPMIEKMFAEVNLQKLGEFKTCLSMNKESKDKGMLQCKGLLMSQKGEGPKGQQHGGGMDMGQMQEMMGGDGMPDGMDMGQMQEMMGGGGMPPGMDMDQMQAMGGMGGGMPPGMDMDQMQGMMGGMGGSMPRGMGMFR